MPEFKPFSLSLRVFQWKERNCLDNNLHLFYPPSELVSGFTLLKSMVQNFLSLSEIYWQIVSYSRQKRQNRKVQEINALSRVMIDFWNEKKIICKTWLNMLIRSRQFLQYANEFIEFLCVSLLPYGFTITSLQEPKCLISEFSLIKLRWIWLQSPKFFDWKLYLIQVKKAYKAFGED